MNWRHHTEHEYCFFSDDIDRSNEDLYQSYVRANELYELQQTSGIFAMSNIFKDKATRMYHGHSCSCEKYSMYDDCATSAFVLVIDV